MSTCDDMQAQKRRNRMLQELHDLMQEEMRDRADAHSLETRAVMPGFVKMNKKRYVCGGGITVHTHAHTHTLHGVRLG